MPSEPSEQDRTRRWRVPGQFGSGIAATPFHLQVTGAGGGSAGWAG
ncbi:hypothetical protein QO034_11355 [Sedimentitalea sp. JM2-8]|uniref:Uncharacterized protein n=1 Tax=Sedimentitalea xiamensis TaxID=3050037 RepID=A0ABT7FF83_9RHOB|nr:hypothetical protein [Sedimentitalea xiamensis]MDK3073710.1 hypothetical protein [Sedimentitalea xiamensis]